MTQLQQAESNAVSLLVVDDDDVDIMAIKRAMRKLNLANPIRTAHNGLEALDILRGGGGREKLPSPFIIVLDLNMPMMNGIDFLDELRSDQALRDSVVFVLSTSESKEDRRRAYQRNVAGYMVKAKTNNTYLDAVKMLYSYCAVVELPEVE